MSGKDDAKSEKMKGKTEEVRRTFNLPTSESCIQDYICALAHKTGRVYITQNFICWVPGAIAIGANPTIIPFNKIKSMKKERNALVFDNALSIETESGDSYFFSSLVHRDETFNLIEYLWKHPPSYVELDDEPDDMQTRKTHSSGLFEDVNLHEGNDGKRGSTRDDLKRSSSSSDGQQMQAQKVDTQGTKNALRIATQAREMGTATLAELTLQAEQIDRIENNVENVHANMDKANRILRGIESVGGAIANSVTKDGTGKSNQGNVDRTLEIHREYPPVDFDILEKVQNDNLIPALLRLFEDKFMCADPQTKKPKDQKIWPYDKIDQLVVRARHQHLDVRFQNKSRFRMCIADIQGIVNEISLRTKPGQIQVVFEPGTRKFSYGKPSIRDKDKVKSSRTNGMGGGFKRNNPQQKSVTKTMFKDASDETKNAILEQEKDLDEISDIVGDLAAIANTMGDELDRQNEQLEHVSGRVDEANIKVKKTNQRIDRLL